MNPLRRHLALIVRHWRKSARDAALYRKRWPDVAGEA